MDRKNSQGQILAEVALVMFFITLVLFGALNQLATLKPRHQKYQFTQETAYEKNPRSRH
ncbi:hypothetical protein D3C87_176320 [compost metagenome]